MKKMLKLALIAAAAATAFGASAQEFPAKDKTITIVVPFAAGGPTDRVARDLLGPWRGREIDKTDGMLLMFDTAADGACYALQYHRALADMAVPLNDYEFVRRLWEDWSPGYDGAQDFAHFVD